LIAGYSDSNRLSDIKANIAVPFVAIMLGRVLQFRELYPWYLSAPVLLAPFMVIFLNLLISASVHYWDTDIRLLGRSVNMQCVSVSAVIN
jgi:hypothetical protein